MLAMEPMALSEALALVDKADTAAALAYVDNEISQESAPRASFPVVDGVAVLAIRGPLVNCACLAMMVGGQTWEGLRASLAQAKADPGVRAVLLDIDSPGGEVAGMQATGHALRALGKPSMAYISGQGCSAALYLASAADVIWAARMAAVGCVGVAMLVSEGATGERQIVSSITPMKNRPVSTPEGEASAQLAVNDLAAEMLGDMAAWRGLPDAAAAARLFGAGDVVVATRAHALGMVAGLSMAPPLHLFNPAGLAPAIPGGAPMPGANARAEAEGLAPEALAEPAAEVEVEPAPDYAAMSPEERAALLEELQATMDAIKAVDKPADPAPDMSGQAAAFSAGLVAQGRILPRDRETWARSFAADPGGTAVKALALKPALHTVARGDARREPSPISAVDKRTAEAGIRARAQANKTDYMTERAAAIAGNPGLKAILEARS